MGAPYNICKQRKHINEIGVCERERVGGWEFVWVVFMMEIGVLFFETVMNYLVEGVCKEGKLLGRILLVDFTI